MENPIAPNLLEPQTLERGHLLKWMAYVLMFMLSLLVFYQMALRPASDISIHATWAAEGDFRNPRTFLRHGAHPLWHVLVALVMLAGVPTMLAAALVSAFLKVAELALIRRLFHAYLKDSFAANTMTIVACICILVMALWVPEVNPNVYLGIGSPNTWHSPTQLIAMVMMLLGVSYTAYCYTLFERRLLVEGDRAQLPWRNIFLLGGILLLSLLAKPTFMQAFLPAACVYFGIQWMRHRGSSRFFVRMMLAALPSALFMVLQYLFYFSGVLVPAQGGVTILLTGEKVVRVLLATILIQAFPLYVLGSCTSRHTWKDPLMTLALLMDVVGIAEYLLLGETGRRASDGNFGWGMMGGALMLWVAMLIVFFQNIAAHRVAVQSVAEDKKVTGKKGLSLRHGIGFILLAWHLLSGIYYLFYLLSSDRAL